MRCQTISVLLAVASSCLADANPAPTPAAQLMHRATDPSIIGYMSASGGAYSIGQSCDFPATASTSGNYVQCCKSGSSCPFWTSCSGNTLMGPSTSYGCDTGMCNTALLIATPGASNPKSDLGCWATSFGSSAFTLVQDIGSATVVGGATAGSVSIASTKASSGSQASATGSSSGSGSGSQSLSTGGVGASVTAVAQSSSSKAGAAAIDSGLSAGGMVAAALAFVQALL